MSLKEGAERERGTPDPAVPGGLRVLLVRHAGALLLGLMLLGVFLLPMRYANHLHMHNEAIRIYAAEAMVHHGTVCLNPVFDEYYPGFLEAGLVPNVDAALRDGCYLLDKAPLLTWLAVPVVWLTAPFGLGGPSGHAQLTWLLVLLWVAIPLTAALLLLRVRLLRSGLSRPVVDLAITGTGFGTALASYGGLYYGHGLAAALVTFGVLLLVAPDTEREGPPRAGWSAVAGACLGAAVLAEYPAAIVVVLSAALLLSTAGGRRQLPWFVLGGLPALGALLAWNTVAFGGPLSLSYDFKQHDAFAELHSMGTYGVHLLGIRHVPRVLMGPERGLLFLSPWLATAFAGMVLVLRGDAARKWRAWRWWVAGVLPIALLFIGSFEDWQAGRGMGPRHWVLLMPLLAVPSAMVFDAVAEGRHRTWAMPLILGLVWLSVVAHVLAAAVFPHFPEMIRNPFAEVVLPVLFLDGPALTVLGDWARWPVLLGLVLGASVHIGFAGVRWLVEANVPRGAIVLSPVVAAVGFMWLVGPHTTGPDGQLKVLQEQRLVMELRDSTDSERLLRQQIERLLHERRQREGAGGAAWPPSGP